MKEVANPMHINLIETMTFASFLAGTMRSKAWTASNTIKKTS